MSDIWSEWLRKRRFGGDAKYQQMALSHLKKLALNLIEKALISENNVVLDIGAGDGLLGLTALEKLGNEGKLILSDISESALSIPREIFNDDKVKDIRVDFLVSDIESLSLPSNSIDRILLRSVLLYVENKKKAFQEIFRVLKPNGIAVISDPINKRNQEFGQNYFRGYPTDIEPLLSVKPQLLRTSKELTAYLPNSFYNYNEHDLVWNCINCGFDQIKSEYNVSHNKHDQIISVKSFFDVSSNPFAPSLREAMKKVLSTKEYKRVEDALKRVIKQPTVRTYCEAILILKK